MLLMESLSGVSKVLMIACASPLHMWAEETISTLNYATWTMNIKNKHIIKMNGKEQDIHNLKRKIHQLKLEKEYLKDMIYKLNGRKPL
jgi:Kinesin motor domain